MSRYPNTEPSDHNLPVYSVGEISTRIKREIERSFDRVRVRGEISGFKRAASGHLYFSLKDVDAIIDAVAWRGALGKLASELADGLDVVATGRVTTYPGRSKYQLIVESVELAGEGALLKLLEERRHRLAAEGLFDQDRKQPLPFLPEMIGVVTSPTGAVIRDILHRLADRFPRPVLVWPVLVQGLGSAEQIAAAIEGFNHLTTDSVLGRPDVLIVARGGGSLEDLWAFNEEIVVRAAAASRIPLISAVGHETDVTLIDFAADVRAPTPTAAAEMAVPVRAELIDRTVDLGGRMIGYLRRRLAEGRTHLTAAERGLPKAAQLLEDARQRLDDRSERLANALRVGIDRRKRLVEHAAARLVNPRYRISELRSHLAGAEWALASVLRLRLDRERGRLDTLSALLRSCSYERVLERGFALVLDRAGGRPITSVASVHPGMGLSLRFKDGTASASVDGDEARDSKNETPPVMDATPPAKRAVKRKPKKGDQGSLF